MRILTIEELMQVTGGGLTKEQKLEVKLLKMTDKDAAKALKKQYYAANKAAKSGSGKSGSGSGKGSGGPIL